MTVTPVRSAPPSWAFLREAPVRSAAGWFRRSRMGGFRHCGQEPNGWFAQAGARFRLGDRASDRARAGRIGRKGRPGKTGAVEPGGSHLRANRLALLRLAPVRFA